MLYRTAPTQQVVVTETITAIVMSSMRVVDASFDLDSTMMLSLVNGVTKITAVVGVMTSEGESNP